MTVAALHRHLGLALAATGGLRPARGTLALVFIATAGVWLALELRQALTRRPEAVKSDGGSLMMLRVSYIGAAALALLAARELPQAAIEPPVLGEWLALILLLGGIGIRLWSFRTLGRYFTFTVQTSSDQPVITDGPYRFLRHPGYAGLVLALAGWGVYMENWAAALVLPAVAAIGLVYRIRVEERALLQTLGDRYRTYAAHRKRLIPLIW